MKLEIKGSIIPNDEAWIYDWLELDYTTPKKVNDYLKNATGAVDVEINSGGGSVFAGSEIYTALKSYKGDVNVSIVGIAASAASVIAMSGDNVAIAPTAQIMIHNASLGIAGDKNDMADAEKILKGIDESISSAYKIKTGLTTEELLEMMDQETWMTAKMAYELGLVDEIMFDNELSAIADISGTLPIHAINKLRTVIKNEEKKEKKTVEDDQKELELKNALKSMEIKLTLKNI